MEEMGCDRRRLDAQSIRAFLKTNGYTIVDDPRAADRIIVVTCAFKKAEEDESVRRLRSLRRYGREILVYGCLADIAAGRYEEFSDIPSVAPRDINTIDRHFEDVSSPFSTVGQATVLAPSARGFTRVRRMIESGRMRSPGSLIQVPRLGVDRLRAMRANAVPSFNLVISRGCMGSCSYCAIRKAVGHVVSRSVEDIVAEFAAGYGEGHRRFNLLGDDTGCYGLDRESSLPELLRALFEASEAVASPAGGGPGTRSPAHFNIRELHAHHLVVQNREILAMKGAGLIEAILCPSQSGSDRILGLMRREHTAGELSEALHRVRSLHPGIRLETQIIVGFPTETVDDFTQTLGFVKEVGFDSVVVFPYDDKEGTESQAMSGKVTDREIRDRMRSAFRFFRRERIPAYRSCP
jgi:MiaB/RimO family radical SAM methylthiotransferase